jgi:hypothetical protein
MPSARRFPPPWTIEEANNACFIVRDSTGQALGYFYFEEDRCVSSARRDLCGGALSNERPYRDHRADVNSRTVAFGYWKSPRVNVARSRFKRPSTA